MSWWENRESGAKKLKADIVMATTFCNTVMQSGFRVVVLFQSESAPVSSLLQLLTGFLFFLFFYQTSIKSRFGETATNYCQISHVQSFIISFSASFLLERSWSSGRSRGTAATAGGSEGAARAYGCSNSWNHDPERRGRRHAGEAECGFLSGVINHDIQIRCHSLTFSHSFCLLLNWPGRASAADNRAGAEAGFCGPSDEWTGNTGRTDKTKQSLWWKSVPVLWYRSDEFGCADLLCFDCKALIMNYWCAVCQSVGGDEKTQTRVSPAVLLSPPQQCDNWQQSPGEFPETLIDLSSF